MQHAVEQAAGGFLSKPEHAFCRTETGGCPVVNVRFFDKSRVYFSVQKRVFLLRPLSPLLEQEWNACGLALVAQQSEPVGMRRPRLWSGLSAGDEAALDEAYADLARLRKTETAAKLACGLLYEYPEDEK